MRGASVMNNCFIWSIDCCNCAVLIGDNVSIAVRSLSIAVRRISSFDDPGMDTRAGNQSSEFDTLGRIESFRRTL